ncbi:biosynthetic peptidoglycan transglycosylase [Oligoflexus tunisiensis]|uniref:biosynthetic peptidoglycan transglycosylase n=1 Tax=Oligoflexus tunisiensis TaxID=708132 RepID=UPI000B065CDE|nr:biosynthetic peptidoglycan transglycosylase [Oligoflexus tunisiensis]
MANDSGRTWKIIILSLGCGLVLLGGSFSFVKRALEEYLETALAAKLATIEQLSFGLGRIALGWGGVHIDQISVRRAAPEKSPEILLTDVNVKADGKVLFRGFMPIDQLTIARVGLGAEGYPALTGIVASLEMIEENKGVKLNFTGGMDQGQVSGTLQLTRQAFGINLQGDLKGRGLRLFQPRIARIPLDSIDADLVLNVRHDPAQDQLIIDELKVNSRGLSGVLSGTVHQISQVPRLALVLTIPSVPCQTLLDALPKQFIPDLQGFQLDGNYAAQFHLEIDYANLEKTRLSGYRGFRDCQFKEAPAHLSPEHLQGSFEHTTRLLIGENQTFLVGPENPNYVPFAQFSDALIGAFLATEDISYFQHSGYVAESLSLAIGLNLMENRFAMGGSTITMQMVKNVLLSHEKTLSRKVQELFLTDYVERTLGKERILEIYLNVIEFGPGIFGVGNAARHFFDKAVTELNQLESVYLASIIYSPRRHYPAWRRGEISKKWDQHLRQILKLMHDKKLISEADYLASHDQTIIFQKPAQDL